MAHASKSHRILYVCRHNTVRSQLAEALTRTIGHDNVNMASAGVEPAPVPEFVSEWVSQLYGSPADLRATSLDDLADQHFDTIITLCDKSHTALPEHPEDHSHIRWDFHHPDDEESLQHLEIELSERIRLFLQANHLI